MPSTTKTLRSFMPFIWKDTSFEGFVDHDGSLFFFSMRQDANMRELKLSITRIMKLSEEHVAVLKESSSLAIPAGITAEIAYDTLSTSAAYLTVALEKSKEKFLKGIGGKVIDKE